MDSFPAEYFRFSTRYPESGTRVQLGRSYQFDTMPEAPDQRTFLLVLLGMTYFVNPLGIDLLIEPGRNLGLLEDFYNRHKTARGFSFQHPVYGWTECKFKKPLEIPEGIAGGDGMVPEFEVELIEIP